MKESVGIAPPRDVGLARHILPDGDRCIAGSSGFDPDIDYLASHTHPEGLFLTI
jgi:hypothetical protein